MNTVLVTRENIHLFEHMVPGLERAVNRTSLGDFWDINQVYGLILNHQAWGFLQFGSGFAGVFVINENPLCKSLSFFWGGQDATRHIPVDYEDLDEFLVRAAKVFQCKFIECTGRKGWKPKIAPLGYLEDSVTYLKEVSYEPVQIQPDGEDGGSPSDSSRGVELLEEQREHQNKQHSDQHPSSE